MAIGQIQILVGTHAVIQPDVIFKNLGMVITDEQHRFGVNQSLLSKKAKPQYFSYDGYTDSKDFGSNHLWRPGHFAD